MPEAKMCKTYQKIDVMLVKASHREYVQHALLKDSIKVLKDKYGQDGKELLFDISGATKRVGIDILTACLAIEISKVTLFELQSSVRDSNALFHKLSPGTDYQYIILPNWGPLVGNIEFFVAQQNRKKLMVVVISIIASIMLLIDQQLTQTKFGSSNPLNWIFIIAIAVIGLVGGVSPIIDAWGGLSSLRKTR